MRLALLACTLVAWPLLAGAETLAPAGAGQVAPAGAGPVTVADLEKAYDAVAAAARESDVAKSRALAAGAVPTLQAALERGPSDCGVLAVAAEAQIRAGLPRDAARTVKLGAANDCDPAALNQLAAWACEFDDDGVRRSPKANLKRCEDLYELAAGQFKDREGGADAYVAALANASELAELRGDFKAGAERARRALRARPDPEMKTRLALAFLRSEGRLVGEGAALDELGEWFDQDAILEVIALRLTQLKARLDQGHDDATSLAAVGFYSLMGTESSEAAWTARYLGEAAVLDPGLPDLWYLTGRAADSRAQIGEAAAAYRRQIAEHPGTPATRLATNDLAHLLATSGGKPAELAEALRLLDAELAKTPEEPAMLDTRGRLLVGLGRVTDGLASLRRAQAIEPSAERKAEIERLSTGPR